MTVCYAAYKESKKISENMMNQSKYSECQLTSVDFV